jgi:aminoglycoside/choline kinase family phosphotransferase
MKLEHSERLFVESLFADSVQSKKILSSGILNVDRLTGDASTRRYYRVETTNESYVVCIDTPSVNCDSKSGNKKVPFLEIQSILQDNKIRVPRILDHDLSKGYILEEDLGDNTMLSAVARGQSIGEELSTYERCLELLINFQAIDVKKYSNKHFTKIAFDEQKLMSEVEFGIRYFVEKYLEYNMLDKERKLILNLFGTICKKLSLKKRVFTHRDYHSRNLMVKDDELVVIDFQDARMGIPQYDLVSLLEDCYYQITPKNLERLKIIYWENFVKGRFDQDSFVEFEEYYDLMAIQRVFKAIGSFSYIYSLRSDKRYLKYIGFGFEKLRTILLKYPEFKPLRQVLSLAYYGN